MSLHQLLNEELKNALKSSDQGIKNYTRNVKSKLSEYCVANKIDRSGLVEDHVVITVISSYKKSLEKAIELLSSNKLGDNLIQEYRNEISFLEKFLPKQEDIVNELSKLVDEVIVRTGANDVKQVGQVVGQIMKTCKERGQSADGALVKKLVTEKLTKTQEE